MTAALTSKPGRIAALDLLRGYFLCVIIVDHLMRFPAGYDLLTGRGQLWASAAEGFFFISGIVLAIVRGREFRHGGFARPAKKIWRRAGQLYLWAVGLTIAFTYIGYVAGTNPGVKSGLIGPTHFFEIFFNAISLRYVYGWADFLPHYAVFLAMAPFALWLIHHGRAWIVALLSAGVWATGGSFNARWQILFFSGMLVGYYLPQIEQYFRNLTPHLKRWLLALMFGATTITIIASTLIVISRFTIANFNPGLGDSLNYLDSILEPFFRKDSLLLPRLVTFSLWFSTLYYLTRHYEAWLIRKLGWLLIPLGHNSLYVYIVHAIILYFLNLVLLPGNNFVVNFLTNTFVIGAVWWLTKHRVLMGIIPR